MTKKITILLACALAVAGVQAQESGRGVVEDAPSNVVKKQTRRQRFDRGLAFDTKTPAMPKGMWVAGLNVSYSEHKNDNYKILVLKDLNSVGNTLALSPSVQYVFANNQSIGVRFQYKRNWLKMDGISLNLGEDLGDFSIDRFEYNHHDYMGYLVYRYYLSLGPSKRFLLFNEVQAGIGGGQQKELSGIGDDGISYKTGTYQNTFNLKAGMMPGMVAFVTNQVAVEVAVGLLGFDYKNITQTTDRTIERNRRTSSISTNIDLLAIQFGMTLYL
jgi:opacity protein-like surface antigen